MKRTGWLRTLIRCAEDAAEDLYTLDRDMHEPDPTCSWCRVRRRLSRAAKMADRQLRAIEIEMIRRRMR